MGKGMVMIQREIVEAVDKWLDENVAFEYKRQPLAQDWARVAKGMEERGEVIAELILKSGQNPRKGTDPEAKLRLLKELADTAMTYVYAIQHFTKDVDMTQRVMIEAQQKHYSRTGKVE